MAEGGTFGIIFVVAFTDCRRMAIIIETTDVMLDIRGIRCGALLLLQLLQFVQIRLQLVDVLIQQRPLWEQSDGIGPSHIAPPRICSLRFRRAFFYDIT